MDIAALDALFEDTLSAEKSSKTGLPPVHLWNPDLTGIMDLIIDREGRWIHEGREIKRPALVKLFSTILKQEDQNYFLVTPVEKWQITVDVAPFFISEVVKSVKEGHQAVTAVTTTNDTVVVGVNHPLWVESVDGNDQPVPLINIRDTMAGLLSRSAFYQLVEWSSLQTINGRRGMFVESMGDHFWLGSLE
jgi:hypothetical protein